MTNKRGERIYRKATPEERVRHKRLREQIAQELPEIRKRAREKLDLLKKGATPLRQVIAALKA